MQNPRLERRDDHYRIRLIVGGKRRNFVCGRISDGRKKAEAKRRELLHQVDHGRLCAPDKITFQQLVDRFREVRFPQLAQATRTAYQYCLGHLLPEIGSIQVKDITRLAVEQLLTKKGKTLSWHSVDQLLRTLRAILNCAVEWNLIVGNPCVRIRHGKKADRFKKRILSPAELRSLIEALDATQDARTGLLVRLLVTSGLRISEAIALCWSDLDMSNCTVTVRRKYYRGDLGNQRQRHLNGHGGLVVWRISYNNYGLTISVSGWTTVSSSVTVTMRQTHLTITTHWTPRWMKKICYGDAFALCCGDLESTRLAWAGTAFAGCISPHYRASQAHPASKLAS